MRPVKGLIVDGSYSLTDTYDRETDRPLEGRALHRGTVSVRYRNKDWGLELSTQSAIVGPRPFFVDIDADGEDDRVEAPTYATIDARVGKQLGDQVTLFIGGQNLLDEGSTTYLPLEPRTIYGGISGRL